MTSNQGPLGHLSVSWKCPGRRWPSQSGRKDVKKGAEYVHLLLLSDVPSAQLLRVHRLMHADMDMSLPGPD